VIRFDKPKPADPSTRMPAKGARVTKAPVSKRGKAAEVASGTADPVSPAKAALAAMPPSGTKGRRRQASAVPGSSDPSVSEGEVGGGREAASTRVRPGTTARTLPEKKASGTKATVRARENRAGSRVEAKPARGTVAADKAGRPQGMIKPARPDDLKLIAGVGP